MKLALFLIVMAITAITVSDGAGLSLEKLYKMIKKVQKTYNKDVKKLKGQIKNLSSQNEAQEISIQGMESQIETMEGQISSQGNEIKSLKLQLEENLLQGIQITKIQLDIEEQDKKIEDLNEEIAACNCHNPTSNPIF